MNLLRRLATLLVLARSGLLILPWIILPIAGEWRDGIWMNSGDGESSGTLYRAVFYGLTAAAAVHQLPPFRARMLLSTASGQFAGILLRVILGGVITWCFYRAMYALSLVLAYGVSWLPYGDRVPAYRYGLQVAKAHVTTFGFVVLLLTTVRRGVGPVLLPWMPVTLKFVLTGVLGGLLAGFAGNLFWSVVDGGFAVARSKLDMLSPWPQEFLVPIAMGTFGLFVYELLGGGIYAALSGQRCKAHQQP